AAPFKSRGHSIISWLVILGTIGALLALQAVGPEPEAPPYRESLERYVLELQGKYFVGAAQIARLQGEQLFDEAVKFQQGPVGHHLCFVALAGELVGPTRALDAASTLRRRLAQSEVTLSATEARALDVLEKIYADYNRDEWSAPSA